MNGTGKKSAHSWTKFHQGVHLSILLMFRKELTLSQKLGFFFVVVCFLTIKALRRMQSPIFSCLRLSLFLLVQIFTSALHALVSLSRRDLNQMEVLLFAIMCCLHICDNQTDAFE